MIKKEFIYWGLVCVVAGMVIGTGFFRWSGNAREENFLKIGSHQWSVEYADTESERVLGLGKRASLPQASGMLFIFPQTDRYQFWMKDMEFPLDLVFITDGKVESLVQNVAPEERGLLSPGEPVKYVLEVNAGETTGIIPGDSVLGLPD